MSSNIALQFPKKYKLLNSKEFEAVFKEGKKFSCRFFAIISRKNNLNYPRLGVVVSKKIVKNATQRNTIKRIIRESFRLTKANLPGFDHIVIIYSAGSVLQKNELHQRLDEQWVKLKSSLEKALLKAY